MHNVTVCDFVLSGVLIQTCDYARGINTKNPIINGICLANIRNY